MLAYLTGTVKALEEQAIIIDVAGVGLRFQVANSALFIKDKNVCLQTYLHWNQEQGPTLFGFQSELEKAIFIMIIGCSGLGPKIALAVLRNLTPTDFVQAVQSGDIKRLSSVNGIGPKKAEQMVVQLRHKVTHVIQSGAVFEGNASLARLKEISDVLESLNYSRGEISQALAYVNGREGLAQASFDELMRHALSFLSKKL